jgi:nucleoside phosphorylase/tetratricopeptide (TPR) repeat protein
MSASGAGIDVLIVTAVKLEYDQALLVDTGAAPGSAWATSETTGPGIAFRTFRAKNGAPMRVALTLAADMGGVETVLAALTAMHAHAPRCIAMCGVCAGRRSHVELGDVIVADRLWSYDTGKIKVESDEAGNRAERVQGDMWQHQLDRAWRAEAARFVPEDAESWLATRPRSYEAQGDWLLGVLAVGEDVGRHPERQVKCADYKVVVEQLWKTKLVEDGTRTLTDAGRAWNERQKILHPDGLPEAPVFKIHVGPIGSGVRVVQDPQIFDRLSESMRKVLGLEMEASAIGAIGQQQGVRAIVMKGVMDFADPAKGDNFKAFAARASAECLIAFLRANLEPTEPGFDDILETGISEKPKNPSPAQMLNARYRFVPFYEPGRAAIMEELRAWCCETEASASARLVYAAGGAGKTRLMSELCERLRGQGWNAGFLAKYASEERFRDLAKSRRPTLVVIDYAESRAILAPLMSIAAQENSGKSESRLRVLLLARGTGDWWEELGTDTQIRDLFAEGAVAQLTPLASERGSREEVFRLAAESLATFREREAPEGVPALEGVQFDRALYVHMAALAAVERRPFTADSLMDETLDHEERFWLVQAHPSLVADKAQSIFRATARRVATAFTLIGGERTRAQARDLLNRLEGQVDESMLSLLHDLYPGASQSSGQQRYVGPLEPDLLGEAMVFRTLHKEDDGADALLHHIFLGRAEDVIQNGLIVLARVSINHEEEVSAWIDRVLQRDLAGNALAALKAAKAVSKDSAHAVLGMVLAKALERGGTNETAERLEAVGIPDGTVSLREVAVWVTSMRLRDLPATEDISELRKRSMWWNDLGVRQSAMRQREAALVSIQKSVAVDRALAAARPDSFLPDLAMSLGNLGIIQSELGQREAALASTEESVAISRPLAAVRPEAFLSHLAAGLNNLGNRQRDLGQREPAVISTQEAVGICRAIAAVRPEAFLPDLAMSLITLGTMQRELGQREFALASNQEAADIYRALVSVRPDSFLPDLAGSLHNLGAAQRELGQRATALVSTEEAVSIRRRLAAARPEAFLPDLAMGLNNLGIMQSELGQRESALASTQDAVSLFRALSATHPEVFLPDLAMSLNNLGNREGELGQRERGLASLEEAVSIRRALAAVRPEAFQSDLAMSLNNLGTMQSELGQRERALASAQEAVTIYFTLAAAHPATFLPDLASSLDNLGNRQSELGQDEVALASTQEAVGIYRTLVAARSEAFLPDFAISLSNQPFQGHFPRDFANNCAVDTCGLSTC